MQKRIMSLLIIALSLLNNLNAIALFPKDFKWGAAIAEFQNSGALRLPHSNWAHFEEKNKGFGRHKDRSEYSINHWDDYKKDIELMKKMKLNSFRFSLDWSSIEPKQGEINQEALEHYHNLSDALIAAGITPMATLHHFTHPQWFDDLGGFEKEENIVHLVNFSKLVFKQYSSKIPLWCTINEPAIYPFSGYLIGIHSPGKSMGSDGIRKCVTVLKNILEAHVQIYEALKVLPGGQEAQIGIVHNVLKFTPRYSWEPVESLLSSFFTTITNDLAMQFFKDGTFDYNSMLLFTSINHKNPRAPHSFDFFGLNYYATVVAGFNRENIFGATKFPHQIMGDMDLPLDPQGFAQALEDVAQFGKPIYVTENGVADDTDVRRRIVLDEYLTVIKNKIASGIDIRGYYHWTLIDNYEWHNGFDPKFGLCSADRIIRASGHKYREFIEKNK